VVFWAIAVLLGVSWGCAGYAA